MVYVFYTRSDKKLHVETFNYHLRRLPPFLQAKILKYRRWEDAQRSLLGKALLMDGLNNIGLKNYNLKDLNVNEFNKPYFDTSIDFNISHSGEFVICAISLIGEIGIDVEEIKNISLDDFINNFSKSEWQEILKKENDFYVFYKYWTQKEAFLKAIGVGLNVPLKEAEVINNKIKWGNKEWFLQEIKLTLAYVSHLAISCPVSGFIIKKINYT